MSQEGDVRSEGRVGTVLSDKWALERLIGVGGMAAVYAARHRNGARAAVKVLHADLSRHPEVRERFLREGYAANRVEHPGVVKVLDDDVVASGPDAGTAYIVMELLEGESLQDRIERGPPIAERELLEIAASILDVLDVAHARGVVHRDLKPENLFLLRDEAGDAGGRVRVKILDFGLARLLQGQAITSYGLALGTPSFMSPEQAAGRIDEIDGRTDLFALAATGFRLRTGRRIHDGANPVELVTKMASAAAPRIRSVCPGVSEPFARVIDRALEFRREDRYASAAEMREDVRRAIAELDAVSSAPEAPRVPRRSPAPAAADAQHPPPPERREPTMEVSASDLETTRVLEPVQAAVAPATERWPEESIRIPKHRSVFPLVVLFVLLLGGAWAARSWFGGGGEGASAPPEAPSDSVRAPVATAAPTTSVEAPAANGGARRSPPAEPSHHGAVNRGARATSPR